jgi:hypothetical protein
LPLTYAGGIGVGVATSLATKYFTHQPFNGIPPAVPFLILLIVLLAVPVARFPRRRASLRSLIPDVKPLTPRAGSTLVFTGLAVLLVVPAVVGAHLPVWIAGLTDVVIFSSLALLVWISGQISLCHAAFVAVGAVAMGHLTTGQHLPWLVAMVLAGLITVPIGALVAIPAIRRPIFSASYPGVWDLDARRRRPDEDHVRLSAVGYRPPSSPWGVQRSS